MLPSLPLLLVLVVAIVAGCDWVEEVVRGLLMGSRAGSGRVDALREPPCALDVAQERIDAIYEESGEVSFIEWAVRSKMLTRVSGQNSDFAFGGGEGDDRRKEKERKGKGERETGQNEALDI